MNLQGKTVYFLGSSITYGSASGGISFADMLCEALSAHMIKEAVSGTTIADVDERSYIARLTANAAYDRVDLFVCQLSTNDVWRSPSLAATEEGLRRILALVGERWGCPVAFYISPRFENGKEGYEQMIAMLYRLQGEYGFSVLDLWNDPDMLAVSEADRVRYMQDAAHPTLAGYREWWLPKFIAHCEAI